MSRPIYAIGDVHGQLEALDRALELIARDGGDAAEVVILGDLVDRGPDSRGVIDRLIQGEAAGRNWHVLRGNHDRLFLNFLQLGETRDANIRSNLTWANRRLGGAETLRSYGVTGLTDDPDPEVIAAARTAVPTAHVDFLESCPLFVESGELLFVHAGIYPDLRLDLQVEDDLIWIREPFLSHRAAHPWLIVHGHTALDAPQHFGNRIDLDGGAGYGRPLHPAVFEGRECWLLTDRGREPLSP